MGCSRSRGLQGKAEEGRGSRKALHLHGGNLLHAVVSYFTRDLAANNSRGVVNKVSGVKLLQGDLSEAWREGETDYASVAMRFSLIDTTIERASGRVVEGSTQPSEATEVWTFQRRNGEGWELSAIQQV